MWRIWRSGNLPGRISGTIGRAQQHHASGSRVRYFRRIPIGWPKISLETVQAVSATLMRARMTNSSLSSNRSMAIVSSDMSRRLSSSGVTPSSRFRATAQTIRTWSFLCFISTSISTNRKMALDAFLQRMPKGAIVAFDELNNRSWPGETTAALQTGCSVRSASNGSTSILTSHSLCSEPPAQICGSGRCNRSYNSVPASRKSRTSC